MLIHTGLFKPESEEDPLSTPLQQAGDCRANIGWLWTQHCFRHPLLRMLK